MGRIRSGRERLIWGERPGAFCVDCFGERLVTREDKGPEDQVTPTYTAALPSDLNQSLRNSFTPSLAHYYPPIEEITPELRELVARLERKR